MFNPQTDYDFRMYSADRESHITLYVEQYMNERLPSLACSVEVVDNKFTGWNLGVWFEIEQLKRFIHKLEHLDVQEHAILHAMSPEDCKISVNRANKKGDLIILYSLNRPKYSLGLPHTILSGGFVFDKEYHMELVESFKQLISVTRLGANMDFTC